MRNSDLKYDQFGCHSFLFFALVRNAMFLAFIFLFSYGCNKLKKEDSSSPEPVSPSSTGIIYSDANDVRLAYLKMSDGKEVTFFGERNVDGSPSRLTGYLEILDQKKYFVGFDKVGRYSSIVLGTGEFLHIGYSSKGDVELVVGGPDSVSNVVYGLTSSKIIENKSKTFATEPSSKETGMDKNVNIKVQLKNTITEQITGVTGNDATVIVDIDGGKDRQYSLQAKYDSKNDVFSIPLTAAGFSFSGDLERKTVEVIQKTLEIACADAHEGNSTSSGISPYDASLISLIESRICPIPHPYAKAVCVAANAILIACHADETIQVLKDALYKIDPNSIPMTSAKIKARSSHKYGVVNSTTFTLDEILGNPSKYDILLTHTYAKAFSPLGNICPDFDYKGWWNSLDYSVKNVFNSFLGNSGSELPDSLSIISLFSKSEMDISKMNLKGKLVLPACFSRLSTLVCDSNELTSIDISALPSLTRLSVNRNKLTDLRINKKSIVEISCFGNELTQLDFMGATQLKSIDCSINKLTSLNVTGLQNLVFLSCWENRIKSLNVSGLTNLNRLQCYQNWVLTDINLSGCTNLFYLSCEWNDLRSLNIQGLQKLANVSCGRNQLMTLDASNLKDLKLLLCSDNKLTSLDVSGCDKMEQIQCGNNKLGYSPLLQLMKDIKNTVKLDWGNCENNNVNSANGPNSNTPYEGSDCSKLNTFYKSKF